MCCFIKYYNIYYIVLSHFLSTDFFVKCRNFCANLQKNERISVYTEIFENFVGYFQKPQHCGKRSEKHIQNFTDFRWKSGICRKNIVKSEIFIS